MTPSPMTPDEFVDFYGQQRASAILRTPHAAAVVPAMDAAVRAGFRVCEFTLNTPDALAAIARLCETQPDVVVGAGTVLTCDDARAAVEAGASFLVSPVVDEEVIECALSLGVAVMPGTATPTEMLRAHRAGAQLIKVFPAPPSGPATIQACLGPLPFLRLVPTSGVDLDNAGQYLAAGAHALGWVAPLFRPEWMAAGNFEAIETRARACLERCAGTA